MSEADCEILAMGSAFPEPPFSCTVHSVYDTAVNLSTDGSDPLVTLIADEALMHPLSALVRGASGGSRFQFGELDLVRGMQGRPENGYLVFDNGRRASAVSAGRTATADESPPAFPRPPAELLAVRNGKLEELQASSGTLLRRSFLSEPVGSGPAHAGSATVGHAETFRKRFAAAALDTARFLQAENAEEAATAALNLVGLGPGLTPSGDDFLCGFLLAAWIRSGTRWGEAGRLSGAAVRSWIDAVLEKADGPKPLTSDVSLSFLRLAKRRLFSRSLVALARSFMPGAKEDIFNEALATLRRLGHSSGLDSATGFLFGLDPAANR